MMQTGASNCYKLDMGVLFKIVGKYKQASATVDGNYKP